MTNLKNLKMYVLYSIATETPGDEELSLPVTKLKKSSSSNMSGVIDFLQNKYESEN